MLTYEHQLGRTAMPRPNLSVGTGNPAVDHVLAEVVALLLDRFPERLRSFYLLGSWAYGDARSTSDIDLAAVFRAHTPPELGREARLVADEFSHEHGVAVGVVPMVEGRLRALMAVQLKEGALHLFGDDIRTEIDRPFPEAWTRDLMHGMYVLAGISRGLKAIAPPLEYPDPKDDFFGLTVERTTAQDGQPCQGTRDLVTGTGWYATALIAWHAGFMVVRKTDVPWAYDAHVGDRWAPFLRELFSQCRDRWDYQIPPERAVRRRLRALCQSSLDFENHFLLRYRDFLIAELTSGNDGDRATALQTLDRLPYHDPEIEQRRRDVASRLREESDQIPNER
jgi:hypothetical protein